MDIINNIKEQIAGKHLRIVLPEGTEVRTLMAADRVIAEELADIILIGNNDSITQLAKTHNLKHITKATIVDPLNNPNASTYADTLYNMRRRRGVTVESAQRFVTDPLYLAALMIVAGNADGELAGAQNTSSDVLIPAMQIIKTKPGISVVSGLMVINTPHKQFGEEGTLFFADIAVHANPDADELAQIAVSTNDTVSLLSGTTPRIAMLSYSTLGSADNECIDKVREATKIAKAMNPSMVIDGELQGDAAIVERIGQLKSPNSPVAGKANTLIFPTLDAGNIAYKLSQHLSGGDALGPILQGLNAPVNDLSRGCTSDEIYKMIIITAYQALKR